MKVLHYAMLDESKVVRDLTEAFLVWYRFVSASTFSRDQAGPFRESIVRLDAAFKAIFEESFGTRRHKARVAQRTWDCKQADKRGENRPEDAKPCTLFGFPKWHRLREIVTAAETFGLYKIITAEHFEMAHKASKAIFARFVPRVPRPTVFAACFSYVTLSRCVDTVNISNPSLYILCLSR